MTDLPGASTRGGAVGESIRGIKLATFTWLRQNDSTGVCTCLRLEILHPGHDLGRAKVLGRAEKRERC
jgi:hypothetical protein